MCCQIIERSRGSSLKSYAWLCLGNCIWKKGDLSSAKNCFTLALSKGPNKQILCQLSMLERKMAQELVDESIQHAKEAITLDVKDGNSWYILGNACLTSFFVTGAWDHSKLLQSLKAYQNAEKDERMQSNPDLYFNCATVNRYLENYESAALKDPDLNATEGAQKIVSLLDKLDNLLRGHARSKRFLSLASSLAAVNSNMLSSLTNSSDQRRRSANNTGTLSSAFQVFLERKVVQVQIITCGFHRTVACQRKGPYSSPSRPYLNLCTAQTMNVYILVSIEIFANNVLLLRFCLSALEFLCCILCE